MEFSFFKAKRQESTYLISGLKSCRLGHKFKVAELAKPQGLFAEWEWDGSELRASVDYLGFYSLFYYASEEEVMVSSSPIQLIAEGAPSLLDERGLGVFFRLGFFLREDTAFKMIKVLPPGGCLVWKDGVTSVTGERPRQTESKISRGEAVDGFIQLFRQGIRRSLESCQGEIVLPLSGGRDSRHILFELKRAGVMPLSCITLNTYSVGFDAEVQAAAKVTEAVNVPFTILSAKSPFRDKIRTMLITHLCSDEHAQMCLLRDYCRSVDCVTLDGIGGDILSQSKKLMKVLLYEWSQKGKWQEIARKFIEDRANKTGFRIEELLGYQETETRFPLEQTVEYIANTLAEFEGESDPIASFLFWNRTRREIALLPTAMLTDARCVLTPYLDSDLFSFLTSLPFEITLGDSKLHDEAIATAFPEYAGIPYHNELTVIKRQPSIWRWLRTTQEGISAVAKINARLVLSEIKAQVTRVTLRQRWGTDVYRYYLMCLDSVSSMKSAQGFIKVITELEEST